jgi:hypothetical protein
MEGMVREEKGKEKIFRRMPTLCLCPEIFFRENLVCENFDPRFDHHLPQLPWNASCRDFSGLLSAPVPLSQLQLYLEAKIWRLLYFL